MDIFILKYIYIIIIMSRCQHGSPWPSLVTRLYHPSLSGGLQGYILYRHRAVCLCVCVFVCVHHMKENPLTITHIFCNIYLSRSCIFNMLDLHLHTKKYWEISNDDLEKPTKFRPHYIPNPSFIYFLFFLFCYFFK